MKKTKKLIARDGFCPYCGSKNIITTDYEKYKGVVSFNMKCNNCNKTFESYYNLSFVYNYIKNDDTDESVYKGEEIPEEFVCDCCKEEQHSSYCQKNECHCHNNSNNIKNNDMENINILLQMNEMLNGTNVNQDSIDDDEDEYDYDDDSDEEDEDEFDDDYDEEDDDYDYGDDPDEEDEDEIADLDFPTKSKNDNDSYSPDFDAWEKLGWVLDFEMDLDRDYGNKWRFYKKTDKEDDTTYEIVINRFPKEKNKYIEYFRNIDDPKNEKFDQIEIPFVLTKDEIALLKEEYKRVSSAKKSN